MEIVFIIFCVALLFDIFNIKETSLPKYCDICSAELTGKYHCLILDDKAIHIFSGCKHQLDDTLFTESIEADPSHKIPDSPIINSGITRTGQPVTKFLKTIKQPRGGVISRKEMTKVGGDDDHILSLDENIHATLIGLTVDYLTRYIMFGDKELSFEISLFGASLVDERDRAEALLENIDTLDAKTVIASLKYRDLMWYIERAVSCLKELIISALMKIQSTISSLWLTVPLHFSKAKK